MTVRSTVASNCLSIRTARAPEIGRTVLDVVGESVTAGALEDLEQQLPEDEGYAELSGIAESEESPA